MLVRDPLKMVFPSAEPVPATRMEAFREQTGPYAAQLAQLRSVSIAALD